MWSGSRQMSSSDKNEMWFEDHLWQVIFPRWEVGQMLPSWEEDDYMKVARRSSLTSHPPTMGGWLEDHILIEIPSRWEFGHHILWKSLLQFYHSMFFPPLQTIGWQLAKMKKTLIQQYHICTFGSERWLSFSQVPMCCISSVCLPSAPPEKDLFSFCVNYTFGST